MDFFLKMWKAGKPIYVGNEKDENIETEMGSWFLQGCTEIIRKISVLVVLHQYVDVIG